MRPPQAVLSLAAILAVVTLAAPAFAAAPASPLRKTAEFKLQHPRLGPAVAALGEHLYVFGGGNGYKGMPLERIDTRTNTSEVIGVTLVDRRFHSVAEYDGKFHLFGGQGHVLPGQIADDRVEIYDPATNQVSRVAPMPRARWGMGAIQVGSTLHLIGGMRVSGVHFAQTNEVAIYDFATGAWSDGPPMPSPRAAPAVAVGAFYVVPGGFRANKKQDQVEMFVPQENGWKKLPPLSRGVRSHSAAFLGQWIFLFGDDGDEEQVLAYDLKTRKTSRLKLDFKGTVYSAAIVHAGKIYVIGGTSIGGERDLVQVYELDPGYAHP